MPYYDVANLVTVTKMTMIRRNPLWLCKIHCCLNPARILPQKLCSDLGCSGSIASSCSAVSAALKVSRRSAQRSQQLHNLTILSVKSRTILKAPPYLQVLSGAPQNTLPEFESTLLSSRGVWEQLEVLGSTCEVARTNLHFADVQS